MDEQFAEARKQSERLAELASQHAGLSMDEIDREIARASGGGIYDRNALARVARTLRRFSFVVVALTALAAAGAAGSYGNSIGAAIFGLVSGALAGLILVAPLRLLVELSLCVSSIESKLGALERAQR